MTRSSGLSLHRRFALLAKPHNLVENSLGNFPLRSLGNLYYLFMADDSNRVAIGVESHALAGNIIDDNSVEILRHEFLTGILQHVFGFGRKAHHDLRLLNLRFLPQTELLENVRSGLEFERHGALALDLLPGRSFGTIVGNRGSLNHNR